MPDVQREVTSTSEKDQRTPKDKDSEKTRKFLALAKERFKLAAEAEAETRKDALDDLEFRIGNQWPQDIKSTRAQDGRPCLTMNRLPAFLKQITNKQREQRTAPQINPVGNDSDVEVAEVLQGIVRHIEVNSDAEIAKDGAFESMVTVGFGDWRIVTQYADDNSFDQEIRIERIKNSFTVYWDPACTKPDYSDADYCFIVSDVLTETYKNDYPDSDAASLTGFCSVGDRSMGWVTQDAIRVAEYYYIEKTKKTITSPTQPAPAEGGVIDPNTPPPSPPQTRDVIVRKVKWAKINAMEILDETVVLGKWIPIVRVLGEDLDVNGKRYLAGAVRSAKDPMRAYNYQVSAATEAVALAPKAPFIVAEGQIEGLEQQWKEANTRNFSYLPYKPTSVGGNTVGPPQRNAVEPPIQAITLLIRQADNDLKAIFGIYDASLGQQGPEQSGKAILARQNQSDISTLNWSDNMARAERHSARILLDLIPKIYDMPHVRKIVKPDKSVQAVGLFNSQTTQLSVDDVRAQAEMAGIAKIYDIGVGRYDVTVSVGPSYQSKRQEAVASMMALVQSYPNMVPIIGDLLVQMMDWPLAHEVAQRLKKGVPPQFLDDDGSDPNIKNQKLQGELQQMAQQHGILVQQLTEISQKLESKQLEQETKLKIAELNSRTQIIVAELNAKVAEAQGRADQVLDTFKAIHDPAHEAGMQAADHDHEKDLAAQQAAAQQQLAASQPTNGATQ